LGDTRFHGFTSGDFTAFANRKGGDKRFNDERKIVWEKITNLQSCLDPKLKQRGFALEGKVSQYWLNYTKRHVSGIWLAYTDVEPYYIVCQLNCGIYKGGFFVGIEINWKAKSHLNNVLSYIKQNKDEFLSYTKQLNSDYLQVTYADCQLGPGELSVTDIDTLVQALESQSDWFSLGEWYPKNESILKSAEIVPVIPEIFETLYPLYLVFAGQRPIGNKVTEELLRIGDVRKKDMTRTENDLIPQVSKLDPKLLDKLIADIDERNKAQRGKRSSSTQNRPYRRNPVLSLALKLRYRDKCQACGENVNVERGFFCDTHHLIQLRAGGTDTSDNILVLCPNHHRIFDRSKVEIISRDKSTIVANASGQTIHVKI
jgi:hypothetical protein